MPPPTPSGPVKAKYKIRLTNKSRYPYRSPTDTTLSKIDVLEYEKAYQIGGLTVQLYFNFTGDFSAYAASTTNRYGSCYIPYSTSLVPYVDHCLGMATVTIDGATYVSNPIRYNFS